MRLSSQFGAGRRSRSARRIFEFGPLLRSLAVVVGTSLIIGLIAPTAQADDSPVLWPQSQFELSPSYSDVLGVHLPTVEPQINLSGALAEPSADPAADYGYDVQIETAANFLVWETSVSGWRVDAEVGASLVVPAEILDVDGQYRLRFRATSAGQTDQWSSWRPFDVVGLAPEPSLVSPANGAFVTAKQVSAQIPDYDPADYSGQNVEAHVVFRFEAGWASEAPVTSEEWAPVDEAGVATANIPVGFESGEVRWQAMWSGQGLSAWSNFRTVTVGSLPATPSNPIAEQWGSTVSLSWWGSGENPYLSASEYEVVVQPGDLSVTVANDYMVSALFENLALGSYIATITPRNVFGEGTSSILPFNVLPVQPGEPRNIEVVVNGSSVDVTWEAPKSDGQSQITGYVVTLGWGPGGPIVVALGPDERSASFDNLTPGSNYQIEVLAENAVGMGAVSTNWITAYGPPGAPTDVDATVGDAFLDVFWTPPASTNGADITEYIVTMMPGGIQQTVNAAWGRQGTRFGDLVNGASYAFTVEAINLGGAGPSSLASPTQSPLSEGIDTDADGVPDVLELRAGSSVLLADTDGDGLSDAAEIYQLAGSTASSVADTDGNGENDGLADSDQDGLDNAGELLLGTEPSVPDSDHDGIDDPFETAIGTDPTVADTDTDGLLDGFELQYELNPALPDSDANGTEDSSEQLTVTLADQSDALFAEEDSDDPPPATLAIPVATAAITGVAAEVAGFNVVQNPPMDLAGALTSAASVQRIDSSQAEERVGPLARNAPNTTTGATSLTLGYSTHVTALRLTDLAPVAWNIDTGSWEFVNNDVSVSTATRTITIQSPVTGLSYAVVDLSAWRSNATECAGIATYGAPLDVEVIVDMTESMDLSDPSGERFAALEAVIGSLPAESKVVLRTIDIFGVSRSSGLIDNGEVETRWSGGANGYSAETGTWMPYETFRSDIAFGATEKELALARVELLSERGSSFDEANLGSRQARTAEWVYGASAFNDSAFSPSVSNPYVEGAPEIRCRSRAIVLVTDGGWRPYGDGIPSEYAEDFGEDYVPFRERDIPVHVLDVGLNESNSSDWLIEIADDTDGTYSYVPTATDLDGWIADVTAPAPTIPVDPTLDSDADGLSDWVETAGVHSTFSKRASYTGPYFSDPLDSDTDNDGVEDGEEVGLRLVDGTFGIAWPSNKPITAYAVRSDPEMADSDLDGLLDFEELEVNMNPLMGDGDGDGLSDSREELYGTYAQLADSDHDGKHDGYEIAHAAEGWDPLLYNAPVSPMEWLNEFGLGFFCGDIEICVRDTIPWLVGSIASGIAVFGDVRDAIVNTIQGNYLAAAFCAAGLIPGLGDAISAAKSVGKFLLRIGVIPSLFRSASSAASAGGLSAAAKAITSMAAMRMLAEGTSNSAFLLKFKEAAPFLANSLDELDVPVPRMKKLVTSNSLQHLTDMLPFASKTRYGANDWDDIGAFNLGSHAEDVMRANLGVLVHNRKLQTIVGGNGNLVKRFPDAMNTVADDLIWYEGKVGLAGSGFVMSQAIKDGAFKASDDEIAPDLYEWHMFMSGISGKIGASPAVVDQLLGDGIDLVVHFPTV